MPIRRYVKEIVVDPAHVEIMSKAFSSALDKLQQSGILFPPQHEEWVRETLALRTIETAQKGGERDLDQLRDDALGHLAQAKPPAPEQKA
jgi:hypothetical protein